MLSPVDEMTGLDDYDRMLVSDMEYSRPIYGSDDTPSRIVERGVPSTADCEQSKFANSTVRAVEGVCFSQTGGTSMFGWIGQAVQILSNYPALNQVLVGAAIHVPRAIERLSPESKERLARIIRWGVERAGRYTLETVLGEVGSAVIDQVVNNREVADCAKDLVKRGVQMGVEKVLKESKVVS